MSIVITEVELSTWNDIITALNSNHGVMTTTVETLRDLDGYGRLGSTVRTNLLRKLHSMGVDIIRKEIPADASATVVLFRQGTPAAQMIDVLRDAEAGSANALTEAADTMRRINMMPDPDVVKMSIAEAKNALDASARAVNVTVV